MPRLHVVGRGEPRAAPDPLQQPERRVQRLPRRVERPLLGWRLDRRDLALPLLVSRAEKKYINGYQLAIAFFLPDVFNTSKYVGEGLMRLVFLHHSELEMWTLHLLPVEVSEKVYIVLTSVLTFGYFVFGN